MALPSRLYPAHTIRVTTWNTVLVNLYLGFGVTVQKSLLVEGLDIAALPPGRRSEATHCLVLVVGGRDLLVHTDDTTLDGHLKARVYLADPAPQAPDGTLAVPYGLDEVRMEVGLMWQWIARGGFDPRETGRRLHGVPKGG